MKTGSFCIAVLLAALAPVPAVWSEPPAEPQGHEHHHAAPAPATSLKASLVDQGLALDLSVEPLAAPGEMMEGRPVQVRLAITDTLSRTPMSRLFPSAWMSRKEDAASCSKRIETFLGGSALTRPEVDLNAYYVLALNQDATISVVDPHFGFGSSRLLAMVFLDSPGEDWVLSDDGERLFVALPDSDQVAVAETATWKVIQKLATGPHPRRLGLQPDGQYLWAAHDRGVAVLDARALTKVADIATGTGSHDLAFSDDSRFAFVTNEAGATVSVIDVGRLAKLRDVPVGSRPISIAWSSQAKAAYAVSAGADFIAVVDGEGAAPRGRVAAKAGLGPIRFAPDGRLAFVVDPGRDTVHILDAANGRIVQTADVRDEPDQVAFSDELAYVRHRGSETVLMIPLKTVGEPGRPVPIVDFPGGERPPGRMPRPTPALGIVAAPGHPSVLVANPEDKVIYYYKEGMAAPMGHFSNYDRTPRAVLVVDRSLRETRPGVYETVAALGPAGDYELALLLDSPRVVQCIPFKVVEDPALAAARQLPLDIQVQAGPRDVAVGAEVVVRVKVADPASQAPRTGLEDVRVLAFLSPGLWQQRQWATEVEPGLYEVRFRPPEEGVYLVFVEVDSANMPYQKSPFVVLEARTSAAGAGGSR